MFLELRPLVNPVDQGLLLFRGQAGVKLWRGHYQLGVIGKNPLNDPGGLGIPRHQRRLTGFPALEGMLQANQLKLAR